MTAKQMHNGNPMLGSITFLITFFLLFLVSLSSNLIQDSCENAAKNDPNLSYEFCVASLEANPRSQNATLQELVIISLGLTISNAKNISSHIEQLLSLKSFDKHTKIGLQDCLELYSDAHSTLLEAMENVKLKDYEGANVEISSAMDASTTCEDGLKEKKGGVSPLTKENSIFFQFTVISLAFINMFH